MGIKILSRYIKSSPVLWLIGLVFPPVFSLISQILSAQIGKDIFAGLETNSSYREILIIVLYGMLGVIIANVFWGISMYIKSLFKNNADKEIKLDIFSKIIHSDFKAKHLNNTGEIFTKYNKDTEIAINIITDDIYNILYPIVNGLGISIAIIIQNWIIGLIIVFLMVSVIILNAYFVSANKKIETEKKEVIDSFNLNIKSVLRGKGTIRLMGIQNEMCGIINNSVDDIYYNENKRIKLSLKKSMTMDWFVYSCATLIMPLACLFSAMKMIELPNVLFITQLAGNIIWCTSSLGTALIDYNNHLVSLKRIEDTIMDSQEKLFNGNITQLKSNEAVKFCDVNIYYDDKKVINNANFVAKNGEITVLSGESGSGKSTIIKSILGFADYKGDIIVLGNNIKDLSVAQTRELIAYVPDTNDMINGTLKENIRFGNLEATDEEILIEMRNVGLNEFIESNQISDIAVGNHGDAISGGQKQRTAIVRGLIKNTNIIILDEPTSAIDPSTKDKIINCFIKLKNKGYAVIISTHDKDIIDKADHIISVNKGNVYYD